MKAQIDFTEPNELVLVQVKELALRNGENLSNKELQVNYALMLLNEILSYLDAESFETVTGKKR